MRTKEKDKAVAEHYRKAEHLRNPTYVGEVEGRSIYKFEVRNKQGVFPTENIRYALVWCNDELDVRPAMGDFLLQCEEELGINTFY